jgi:hypothetical protein
MGRMYAIRLECPVTGKKFSASFYHKILSFLNYGSMKRFASFRYPSGFRESSATIQVLCPHCSDTHNMFIKVRLGFGIDEGESDLE